jgi:hypothetical protein
MQSIIDISSECRGNGVGVSRGENMLFHVEIVSRGDSFTNEIQERLFVVVVHAKG